MAMSEDRSVSKSRPRTVHLAVESRHALSPKSNLFLCFQLSIGYVQCCVVANGLRVLTCLPGAFLTNNAPNRVA